MEQHVGHDRCALARNVIVRASGTVAATTVWKKSSTKLEAVIQRPCSRVLRYVWLPLFGRPRQRKKRWTLSVGGFSVGGLP